MGEKRKIIIVTDGDRIAKKAVEIAARNIGGRCVSRSAGNPTPLTCDGIVTFIKQCPNDPVVIMADDVGTPKMGSGEIIMKELADREDIEILGIIAVASNTPGVEGVKVDCSIDNNLQVIHGAVDKAGNIIDEGIIYGDTIDILNYINVPVVIGMGDPGKMDGRDDCSKGAPVMTKALKLILDRSGIK